jgi:hypothetical protein
MKEPTISTLGPTALRDGSGTRSRSQYLGLGLIFTGLGVLFSSNYLSTYSYSTTAGLGTKDITITLHYPLLAFLPLAYAGGPALIAIGLFEVRKLLVTNIYVQAGMAWVGLTILSLGAFIFTNTIFQAEPEHHLFNVYGASFAPTPLYLSALGFFVLFTMAPSLVGVWMSLRLLSRNRRMLLSAFGLGAILTLVSLLSVQYTDAVGMGGYLYSRGFPLPWLVLPNSLLAVPAGWYPTEVFVLDFLFWSGLAHTGIAGARYLSMGRFSARSPIGG